MQPYSLPMNAALWWSMKITNKLFAVLLPLFEGHTHTHTNFSRGQCGYFAAADPSPVLLQSAHSLSSIRGVPLSLPSAPAC